MLLPLQLLARALALWWREFAFLILVNVIWLICQATVVLGPPATAALAGVAQRVLDGELVDLGDFWRGLLREFGPAWKWGLAQLVVYGVLGFNLWFYREQSTGTVLALRYAWTLMASVWFAVNLYFWPLHHEQTDRRFRTTITNAGKMALLNPNATLVYAVAALLFIAVSLLSGALLGIALGVWLSLWGKLVVREHLRSYVH